MKFIAPVLILVFGLQSVAWGQQSCPLNNASLNDLRAAASKLAVSITLSPECQSYQNNINQASTQLKGIADQIAAAEAKKDGDTKSLATLASQAVTNLDSINAVFNDKKCGQQLAGFLDYAGAFVDVVTGFLPFLALYGGSSAAPWVLGPALGGATAKTLIAFFKNKAIDMRNPDQSDAFLKNSCSFYNLNLIKMSLDDLQLNQEPKIQSDIQDAKNALEDLKKSAPPQPASDSVNKLTQAKKDLDQISFIQARFAQDPLEACTYMNVYATEGDRDNAGSDLVTRTWSVYAETAKDQSFKLELERKYFQDELNRAMAEPNIDLVKCKDIGSRWSSKIRSFIESSMTELSSKVNATDDSKAYAAWVTQKEKQELLIKTLEGRLKFFTEMKNQGFNIQYSEIIRSHQQIEDALFESYRYLKILKMKGLAEAWLKVKYEDASYNINSFKTRKEEVDDQLKEIQKYLGNGVKISQGSVRDFSSRYVKAYNLEHPKVYKSVLVDVCNQLRMTWSSWYNGLIHARAGRDYCVAFDNVINGLDYPDVQNLCFGTTTNKGYPIRSLKNLANDIFKMKAQADEIAAKMKELECRETNDLTQDVLKLSLKQ